MLYNYEGYNENDYIKEMLIAMSIGDKMNELVFWEWIIECKRYTKKMEYRINV